LPILTDATRAEAIDDQPGAVRADSPYRKKIVGFGYSDRAN